MINNGEEVLTLIDKIHNEKPYGTVLIRANDILNYLLNCNTHPTLAEISTGLKFSKPTTLKILNTLELLGWVIRYDQTKQYFLGTQLISFGDKALASMDLVKIARPYLTELRDKTQETINLGIVQNEHIILIDKLESPMSVKLQSTIGGQMNLYSSSMGKAVLATYKPSHFKDYLATHQLTSLTNHTITSAKKLQEDINLIKQTGFAMDNEENEADVFCLGATIKKNNRLYGAFSISTPTYRLPEERKNKFVRLLLNTQAEIENKI